MKTWSVDAARAYLPRLRELLVLIEEGLVPGPAPGSYGLAAGAEHSEAALAELEERGVVLRQLSNGLVDFTWEGPDGEIRMLCWHRAEDDLQWWHRPEDGFAGRRPIADVTWPGQQ